MQAKQRSVLKVGLTQTIFSSRPTWLPHETGYDGAAMQIFFPFYIIFLFQAILPPLGCMSIQVVVMVLQQENRELLIQIQEQP